MRFLGAVKSGEYVGEWYEIEAEAAELACGVDGHGPSTMRIHEFALAKGIDERRWGVEGTKVWIQGVKIGSEKKA